MLYTSEMVLFSTGIHSIAAQWRTIYVDFVQIDTVSFSFCLFSLAFSEHTYLQFPSACYVLLDKHRFALNFLKII